MPPLSLSGAARLSASEPRRTRWNARSDGHGIPSVPLGSLARCSTTSVGVWFRCAASFGSSTARLSSIALTSSTRSTPSCSLDASFPWAPTRAHGRRSPDGSQDESAVRDEGHEQTERRAEQDRRQLPVLDVNPDEHQALDREENRRQRRQAWPPAQGGGDDEPDRADELQDAQCRPRLPRQRAERRDVPADLVEQEDLHDSRGAVEKSGHDLKNPQQDVHCLSPSPALRTRAPDRPSPPRPTPGPSASSARHRARPRSVSSTLRSVARRCLPWSRFPRPASTCPSPPASPAVPARASRRSRT